MYQLQCEFENVQKQLQCLRSRKGRRSQHYYQCIAAAEHRSHNLQEQIHVSHFPNVKFRLKNNF